MVALPPVQRPKGPPAHGAAIGGLTGAVVSWIAVGHAAIKQGECLNCDDFVLGLREEVNAER